MNNVQPSDINLLVDARKEYTLTLAQVVRKEVLGTLDGMYAASCAADIPKSQRMRTFQTKLRQVQFWNQSVVELHTNRITNDFTFFTALLSAVFD